MVLCWNFDFIGHPLGKVWPHFTAAAKMKFVNTFHIVNDPERKVGFQIEKPGPAF